MESKQSQILALGFSEELLLIGYESLSPRELWEVALPQGLYSCTLRIDQIRLPILLGLLLTRQRLKELTVSSPEWQCFVEMLRFHPRLTSCTLTNTMPGTRVNSSSPLPFL